jgi:predicted Zn-dependent protease
MTPHTVRNLAVRRLACGACIALALGLAAGAAAQDPAPDAVFRAMQEEMARSMSDLKIESMSPPSFLSYRVQDVDEILVEARYGALTQGERSRDRYFSVDLRVGTPEHDNSWFIGGWQDAFRRRDNLAEENDYRSLRHDLWLFTDRAYKNALENFSRKDAYLQAHPPREAIPDFSAAAPFVYAGRPGSLEADLAAWERDVAAAARVLAEFAALQDWKVSYQGRAATVRYLNSEGSRHLKGAATQILEVTATTQAADGQRLSGFLRFVTRDADRPPTGEPLAAQVRRLAADLQAMAAAPRLDEYAGPVLFDDVAAAQLVSQLFVTQLTPPRKPIFAEEWMAQGAPDPKLVGRLQRRVLPDFVAIEDDPTREVWQGVRLVSSQAVDDEGVPARALRLVERGRLLTLPMSRTPIAKIRESNGHGRSMPNQWIVPTVSNLIVSTSQPRPDLVKELRQMAHDFGNEYGLLVTRLEDPGVSGAYRWTDPEPQPPELLTAPLLLYRVYAADGRVEPVRGLVFDEVSIRTLRDIVAMGKETAVHNLAQTFDPMDFRYLISIVTPSILVEEMELKANPAREPLTVSRNPMFAD